MRFLSKLLAIKCQRQSRWTFIMRTAEKARSSIDLHIRATAQSWTLCNCLHDGFYLCSFCVQIHIRIHPEFRQLRTSYTLSVSYPSLLNAPLSTVLFLLSHVWATPATLWTLFIAQSPPVRTFLWFNDGIGRIQNWTALIKLYCCLFWRLLGFILWKLLL